MTVAHRLQTNVQLSIYNAEWFWQLRTYII
jgi:hypothetical protein